MDVLLRHPGTDLYTAGVVLYQMLTGVLPAPPGTGRSRGAREARPNPKRRTAPVSRSTTTFAGRMSLWMIPRACNRARAAREADGDAQEAGQGHGPAHETVEGLAARIFEQEHRDAIDADQVERADGPRRVQLGAQRVLVLQPRHRR